MFIKLFIGLVAVYIVDQTNPSLAGHALGLYLLAIVLDAFIFITEGILWGRR